MLNLFIVESTADKRNKLNKQISAYLHSETLSLELLPKVSISSFAAEEIKYQTEPDICILGEDIAVNQIQFIKTLKETWPGSSVLVQLSDYTSNIPLLESLARMGIDDTFSLNTSTTEFLGKLLILSQKQQSKKNGTLIVIESGKGGLGISSITAALGEAFYNKNKKVLLIDFDFDSQDLSRFLLARPYYNENLGELFRQKKPLTKESFTHALIPVWPDTELYCLSPCAQDDLLTLGNVTPARTLLSILEIADEMFDITIIDTGSLRGSILNTIYRLADELVYLISNDPAALFPSVSKFKKIWPILSLNVAPVIFENAIHKKGIKSKILREELSNLLGLNENCWISKPVQFNQQAFCWPGSGYTLFSMGDKKLKQALIEVTNRIKGFEERRSENLIEKIKNNLSLPEPLKKLPLIVSERSKAILPKIDPEDTKEDLSVFQESTEIPLFDCNTLISEPEKQQYI